MQLTRNFSLEEMTHSPTAEAKGIDNTPPGLVIQQLAALCEKVLQPIRDRFGPCRVDSGYRCPELNTCVHGEKHSQHLLGQACDFKPLHATLREVADWILENLVFDEMIYEANTWIHVSYRLDGANRKKALTASFTNGAAHYVPYRA